VAVDGPDLRGRTAQTPDVPEKFLLGEDPGRIGGEDPEQGELFLRQPDLAVTDRDLATGRVDQQLPHPYRLVEATVGTVQDGIDPGRETSSATEGALLRTTRLSVPESKASAKKPPLSERISANAPDFEDPPITPCGPPTQRHRPYTLRYRFRVHKRQYEA
jgi:hypothetical protein